MRRRRGALTAVALTVLLSAAGPAAAQAPAGAAPDATAGGDGFIGEGDGDGDGDTVADDLDWEVFVDERDVTTVTAGDPVVLDWREPAVLDVRVQNDGPEVVQISRVRLEARVLGLAFFAYSTDVDIELEPGAEDQRTYSLDMQDLYGQATGKLPGRVVLLDGRTEVDAVDVPVRLVAPLRSVYGLFGVAVGAVTLVLLWGALWALARGRLHENRWRRATAFMVPGVGLGFTLTFTVSAMGWFLPEARLWVTLVVVCAGAGFAVGYLTPTPDADEVDDWDDDGTGGDVASSPVLQ